MGRPLARYFFDVQVDDRCVRDISGMDLRQEGHAIREATLIVWQLLSDASAEKRTAKVSVRIRTEAGACVYEASTSSAGD